MTPLRVRWLLSWVIAVGTSCGIAKADAPSAAVSYHTIQLEGVKVFYREAGPANAPAVLLLHGFPASSFMFRDLMSQMSGEFHVIAPDYPGFGYSDAPSTREFSYSFDHLAAIVDWPTGWGWSGMRSTCRISVVQ